jgi:hypothetical protein
MEVRSEHNASEFLRACWDDPNFGNDQPLVFKNCLLRIRLDPGDGQADWRITRAAELLQQHMNLTYLLAKHGTPYGRLGEFDRDRLSVNFKVEPGSTNITFDYSKPLTAIQQILQAHWSMRTRNIVTAGVFIAGAISPFVYQHMTHRNEIEKAQIAAAAVVEAAVQTGKASIEVAKIHASAQLEAATFAAAAAPRQPEVFAKQLLAALAREDTSNVVAFALSDYVPWRPALLALAPHAGTFQWNDEPAIPAKAAKAIAKVARAEAVKQKRIAKQNGHPRLITTPWVTEVVRSHQAPGSMRLGLSAA